MRLSTMNLKQKDNLSETLIQFLMNKEVDKIASSEHIHNYKPIYNTERPKIYPRRDATSLRRGESNLRNKNNSVRKYRYADISISKREVISQLLLVTSTIEKRDFPWIYEEVSRNPWIWRRHSCCKPETNPMRSTRNSVQKRSAKKGEVSELQKERLRTLDRSKRSVSTRTVSKIEETGGSRQNGMAQHVENLVAVRSTLPWAVLCRWSLFLFYPYPYSFSIIIFCYIINLNLYVLYLSSTYLSSILLYTNVYELLCLFYFS